MDAIDDKPSVKLARPFRNEDLMSIKIPTAVEDSQISDKNIVTALNLIYEGIDIKAATPYIVKLLCSLAYYELKKPGYAESKSLFDISTDGGKLLYESEFPGGHFIEDPDNFMTVLSRVTSESEQVADDIQDDSNRSKLTKTEMMIRKAQKQTSDELARLRKLYAKVNNQTPIKKFPEDTRFTVQERSYIGAWAYYHLRCIVKGAESMRGWQLGEVNRMNKLITSLLGCWTTVRNKTKTPPFSVRGYNLLNQAMNHHSSGIHARGMLIRSYALYLFLKKNWAAGYTSDILHILEGLLIQTIQFHGMEVLNLHEKLRAWESYKEWVTFKMFVDYLNGTVCIDSFFRLYCFYWRYLYEKDQYDKIAEEDPQWAAAVGDYIECSYWPIARAIDRKYFVDMGVKGNEPLISMYVALINHLKPSKPITHIKMSSNEECKRAEVVGVQIAQYLIGESEKWTMEHGSELMKAFLIKFKS